MKCSCCWQPLPLGTEAPSGPSQGLWLFLGWGKGGEGSRPWVQVEVCSVHAWTGLTAVCLPVCHSVLSSGWEGPRWKKKKCAGYSLAFPSGHTQEEGEARHRQGDSSAAVPEILLLIPFVNTSRTLNSVCTGAGIWGEANNTWVIRFQELCAKVTVKRQCCSAHIFKFNSEICFHRVWALTLVQEMRARGNLGAGPGKAWSKANLSVVQTMNFSIF